ncbi:MAG: TRAP transporter large permease [Spirochaetales bacterium]|jgi:tripartite ATP-independent transporter DctM subunit|nr:TRAP transporter large permease [Spirochaetales bacterium]
MNFWSFFPIVLMFLLFFLNIPVGFAMIIAASSYYLWGPNSMSVTMMCQKMIAANESFVFLAIPFFTCASVIFNYSGITRKLMNLADMMMGHLVGGMGHVNILLSTFMGGLSGSALADTVMDSKMLVPEMERLGYSKAYSCVVTAASSCITPIIPPGIILILYAASSNVSVAKLFYAGYLPGLVMMGAMLILNHFISRRRRYKPSRERRATAGEFGKALKEAIWALMVPFGIIMGLRFGIFTPTEAGAIAIFYAIFIGAVLYRELKLKHLKPILIESVTATASVMFILTGAQAFSSYLTWERVPILISEAIVNNISSPYMFLLIVNVLLFVIGLFFDGSAAMILLAPLLVPAAAAMRIDLIQFGIVLCVNLTLGSITPPFGPQMFATCAICGCKLEDFAREVIPFVVALIIVILLLSFVPPVSLLVPALLS